MSRRRPSRSRSRKVLRSTVPEAVWVQRVQGRGDAALALVTRHTQVDGWGLGKVRRIREVYATVTRIHAFRDEHPYPATRGNGRYHVCVWEPHPKGGHFPGRYLFGDDGVSKREAMRTAERIVRRALRIAHAAQRDTVVAHVRNRIAEALTSQVMRTFDRQIANGIR